MFAIRIVPGSAVRSDPPCDFDFALLTPTVLLGQRFWVIRRVWNRGLA